MHYLPGVDMSSGSLGQGLSIINGIAVGLKKQGRDSRVYCRMAAWTMDRLAEAWKTILQYIQCA